MHLWPSTRLRDSFKWNYLKKLEWNLHRMSTEKRQSAETSNQKKLLDSDDKIDAAQVAKNPHHPCTGALAVCTDLLMIFSCCYCCYCCGACIDGEGD